MSTYEMIVDGNSNVHNPLYHTRITRMHHDGTDSVEESNPYMPMTRQVALDQMLDTRSQLGGYTIAYYSSDGFVVCGDCLKVAYDDDNAPDYDDLHDGKFTAHVEEGGDYEDSTGLLCESCNLWIVEPHCLSCAMTIEELTTNDTRVFTHEDGSLIMCGDCITDTMYDTERSFDGLWESGNMTLTRERPNKESD